MSNNSQAWQKRLQHWWERLLNASTIWGYVAAFAFTWLLLWLFNSLWVSPQLSHLNQPLRWTAEQNVFAIAEAYGDEETGVVHLSPQEVAKFKAFAFNGSFIASGTKDTLWRKWVIHDHTIKDEMMQRLKDKDRKIRTIELKMNHDGPKIKFDKSPGKFFDMDLGPREESFLSIIWSSKEPRSSEKDKNGDRIIVGLELYAPPDKEEIRYQIYAIKFKKNMKATIGIKSPLKGKVLYSRPNYGLFRPCHVSTSEHALAESFFPEGKRIIEAAGITWNAPLTEEEDRVKRYIKSVLLRWTSRDEQNIQQLSATARFFNGPDWTGIIQFMILFVSVAALLNCYLYRNVNQHNRGWTDVFRVSLIPLTFAQLTVVLFGTLGTMWGMRAVSQEIGQPELNTISISTGLSVAYDTTALALVAVLIVTFVSLFVQKQ